MIHPDLQWKPMVPLYVIFIVLQDVSVEMGPTFLLVMHVEEVNNGSIVKMQCRKIKLIGILTVNYLHWKGENCFLCSDAALGKCE